MKPSAYIFLSNPGDDAHVAGLSVLERLALTLRRGGCGSIFLIPPSDLTDALAGGVREAGMSARLADHAGVTSRMRELGVETPE